MKKIDRTGEIKTMKSGETAIIVSYRNANDIDVAFKDGQIAYNVRYCHFKNGDIKTPLIIEKFDDYAKITNINASPNFSFLVDIDDLSIVKNVHWYRTGRGHEYVEGGFPAQRLHRLIMGAPDNMVVDHINGITTDNRKSNLRICTISENVKNQCMGKRNKSGYKGVYFHSGRNKWHTQIRANGKRIHIGYFDNKEEAAKAYNEAAIKYHGEFAKLNNI